MICFMIGPFWALVCFAVCGSEVDCVEPRGAGGAPTPAKNSVVLASILQNVLSWCYLD